MFQWYNVVSMTRMRIGRNIHITNIEARFMDVTPREKRDFDGI